MANMINIGGKDVYKQSFLFPSTYVVGLERFEEVNKDNNENNNEEEGVDYQDDDYFDSYNELSIHYQMLQDTARTMKYKKAIESIDMTNKIVMDIGCGTGILSMFCAKHGAKHVYAIEASDLGIITTKNIIKDNNLQDKITVIHGKIEDNELISQFIQAKSIDIIISEWMGSFLICESMIESVIYARDMYLKDKTGILIPENGTISLCPIISNKNYKKVINFWSNVYNFNMKTCENLVKKQFFDRPFCNYIIQTNELISKPIEIRTINMYNCTIDSLEYHKSDLFEYVILNATEFHGFGSWFSVQLSGNIMLNTSPDHPTTHWKQITCLFKSNKAPFYLNKDDKIVGYIETIRNKIYRRHYQIIFTFSIIQNQIKGPQYIQKYALWR